MIVQTVSDHRLALLPILIVLAGTLALPSCSPSADEEDGGGFASATQITSRSQLIGGHRALGDIGDYLLENDRIRIIIQDAGFSRGFGVYGGSIIDADIRRVGLEGDSRGGVGMDSLGEIFPAFFLQAVAVDRVDITHDGRDGGPARIVASGRGGDFLTLVSGLVGLAVDERSREWCAGDTRPARPERPVTFARRILGLERFETLDDDTREAALTAHDGDRLALLLALGDEGWAAIEGLPGAPSGRVETWEDLDEDERETRTLEAIERCENPYRYEVIYTLAPGDEHAEVTLRAINDSGDDVAPYRSPAADPLVAGAAPGLLRSAGLPSVPIGDVALFGDTAKLFVPGIGFDLRFGIERAYAFDFPADTFAGLPAEFIATRTTVGDAPVSYGFLAAPSEHNFAYNSRVRTELDDGGGLRCGPSKYEGLGADITPSTLMLPFVASGFVGIFHGMLPLDIPEPLDDATVREIVDDSVLHDSILPWSCRTTERASRLLPMRLGPGEDFQASKYLIVGAELSNVLDTVFSLQGLPTGRLTGRVIEERDGVAAAGSEVVVYQVRMGADGEPFNRIFAHFDVDANGTFSGRLPPGDYTLRVVGTGRLHAIDPQTGTDHTHFVPFAIRAGETTTRELTAPPRSRITVRIVDAQGRPLPAKATAVGAYDPRFAGQNTMEFLYDLEIGESFVNTDMVVDDPDDPSTLRYIERVSVTRDGIASLTVRPGTYTVVASRGPEYSVAEQDVTVAPGRTESITLVLDRTVDTRGWIASDFHIHTINSIDAGIELDDRVLTIAAEGVEFAVSTDHNFITDLSPWVLRNNLQDWMVTSVGLEVTTLEAGHFNGFPLTYEVGPITHGAFEWSGRPPAELIADLRSLGAHGPENTIVQINHPRDSIIGYFDQFRIHGLTTEVVPPSEFFGIAAASSGSAFFEVDENGNYVLQDEDGNLWFNRPVTSGFQLVNDAGVPWEDVPDAPPVNSLRRVSTFTLGDTDTIELLNGKRLDQLRHYRIPFCLDEEQLEELGFSASARAGQIVVDDRLRPENPGAVDDWFNLLNLGERIIGVGNSDTHAANQEAGVPRTMVWVGESDPRRVHELDVVQGLRAGRAFSTNGPMIDFHIDDPDQGIMGSEIRASGGEVELVARIQTPEWFSVSQLNIWQNGLIADRVFFDSSADYAEPVRRTLSVDRDSWFVLELIGDDNFFPVVRPNEIPRLDLTDAVGALASILPFGSDAPLEVDLVAPASPYAITNPVWVRTSDSDWTAPGLPSTDELIDPRNDPGINQNPFSQQHGLCGLTGRAYRDAFRAWWEELEQKRTRGDHHHGHGHRVHHRHHHHGHRHHGHGHHHHGHGHHHHGHGHHHHGVPDPADTPGEQGMYVHRHTLHTHLIPMPEVPRGTYDIRRLFDLFCDGH
ncbi:MAG: hypothetical protein EA398_03765 [Deltaproteobacteria bacterium]|nr:MAG: hypothetical protein EA398_03765 [Deltaproteobacteria bacterium]